MMQLSEPVTPIICSLRDACVQVLKETKQLCSSAVEPLVNRVDAVKQYGVDKVVMCLFSLFVE